MLACLSIGFVGAKKKTSVGLLVYNSSMIKEINILKAAHAILLTPYFIGHHPAFLPKR